MADDSKTNDVGDRYARALFDLAMDNNALKAVEADMETLSRALAESRDLTRLIESPSFSAEDKGRGLVAVAAKSGVNMLTAKFVGLLAANGRARDLAHVITSFRNLAAAHRGAVTAEVVSALPLTPAQSKGIAADRKSVV